MSGAIAAFVAPTSNNGFKDAASVLTFAGLVAVGIERLIEVLWTLVGQAKNAGGWWPLSAVKTKATEVESQTNLMLTTIFDQITSGLTTAKSDTNAARATIEALEEHLRALPKVKQELGARFTAAQALAPGSARLEMVSGVANRASTLLGAAATAAGAHATAARGALETASSAASIALSVVGAFQDNPARRIASILIGSALGMLTASFMGLNVFAAVLSTDAGLVAGKLGVVLTGVLVGLGASPTHEVIKALQEFKEGQQKTGLVGIPSVFESTDASSSMLELASAPRAAWAPKEGAEVRIRTTD
ncbi:MAG: hypothetical protein ACR2NO_03145 [Chloroflexota bacterium]